MGCPTAVHHFLVRVVRPPDLRGFPDPFPSYTHPRFSHRPFPLRFGRLVSTASKFRPVRPARNPSATPSRLSHLPSHLTPITRTSSSASGPEHSEVPTPLPKAPVGRRDSWSFVRRTVVERFGDRVRSRRPREVRSPKAPVLKVKGPNP